MRLARALAAATLFRAAALQLATRLLSRFSAGVGPLLLATSLLLLLRLPGFLGLRTTGLVLGWTRRGMRLVRLVLLQGVELTPGLGEFGLRIGQASPGLLLLSLLLTI